MQEGPGRAPAPLQRALGNTQQRCDLFQRQAGEIPQLDQLHGLGIDGVEITQRAVKVEQAAIVDVRFGHVEHAVERGDVETATAFFGLLATQAARAI